MSRRICENQRDSREKMYHRDHENNPRDYSRNERRNQTWNDTHKHHYKIFAFYRGIKPFITESLFRQ